MSDEEIAKILQDNLASADACNALIALALKRGAPDNVTVLLARYKIEQDSKQHRSILPD